jgi:hypothetical protein
MTLPAKAAYPHQPSDCPVLNDLNQSADSPGCGLIVMESV